MIIHITNEDGSMYVHQLRGAIFITWVSKKHKSEAMAFPAEDVEQWIGLIENTTGVICKATPPRIPGML